MRRLNRKRFFGLMLCLVTLVVGVHLLHRHQVVRNAQVFLQRADQARAEEKPDEAAEYIRRYLQLVPDDVDAMAEFGVALDELGRPDQAFLTLEKVLRLEPQRREDRVRLVRAAMAIGRWGDALEHLDRLLRATPDDGMLEDLVGQCHEASGDYTQARQYYAKAIQDAPENLECYVRLARLLRHRLDQPQEADDCMDSMVEANAESVRSYLLRGVYRKEFGSLDEASEDLARALEIAPDEADVLLAAADIAQAQVESARGTRNLDEAQGYLDKARSYLNRGLELYPTDARLYRSLASIEARAGQHGEVVAVLRRGVERIPDDGNLMWGLADLLIQKGQLQQAREVMRLGRDLIPPALLTYLSGRVLLFEGRWREAREAFEQIRPELTATPELMKQAELFLGQAYGQLGQTDQQLAAYRRALELDPTSVVARYGVAMALEAMGRVDDAIREYLNVMNLPGAPAVGWLKLARLLTLRNVRLPVSEREWELVSEALTAAEKTMPESVDVPILQAEAISLEDPTKLDQARQVLTTARNLHPEEPRLWTALASVAERQGKAEEALDILDEAQRRMGDHVELRAAQARYWANRGDGQARRALRDLADELEKLPHEQQFRLLGELAEAHQRIGDFVRTLELLAQAVQLQPYNVRVRLWLFELALLVGIDAKSEAELERTDELLKNAVAESRKIDVDGALWRYGEATRLLMRVEQGRTGDLEDDLKQARGLLAEVALQRPDWAMVARTQAEIDELEGDEDAAIDNYLQAIELGDRSPRGMRRLVQLLFEQRRYEEADHLIRRFPRATLVSVGLLGPAVTIALLNQDYALASRLIEEPRLAESQDYQAHIWHGRVLTALGRLEEAEAAFRHAVRLADQAPEAWVALVQFLASTERAAQAADAIDEAQQRLPAEAAPLALAQCYEVMGSQEEAGKHYETAVRLNPDDMAALRSAASFCLRSGRTDRAKQLLKTLEMKAPQEHAAWARRNLALVLAAGGNFQQAEYLLKQNLQANPDSEEDLRAKAALYATQRGRDKRREAIRILEDLVNRQNPLASDQFLLAQLYEANGEWAKARSTMRSLMGSGEPNPAHMAYYARGLLGQGELDEAQLWSERLAQLQPVAFQTVQLTARVLARQGRVQEALDLCDQAWQSYPPELAASASLAAIRSGSASPEQFQRVEQWLQTAVQKHPEAITILLHLAELHDLQGRFDEAEAIYSRVLERDDRNIVALNNWAWLLALQGGDSTESLELINRAIGIAGEVPGLLDTRAIVHLAMRRPDQAIRDLEKAVQQDPAAPKYFHLAQAHWMAEDPAAAQDAFEEAQELGLNPRRLHPLELGRYDQLLKQLGPR